MGYEREEPKILPRILASANKQSCHTVTWGRPREEPGFEIN